MRVFTLAGKDMRLLARDFRSAVVLIAMPLLFVAVLGVSVGEGFGRKGDDKLRVSVVNKDCGLPDAAGPFPGRPWSEVVLDDLANTGGVRVELIGSLDEAQRLGGATASGRPCSCSSRTSAAGSTPARSSRKRSPSRSTPSTGTASASTNCTCQSCGTQRN